MKNKFNFLAGLVGLLMFTFTLSHAQPSSLMTNANVSTEIEGTPYLDDNFVASVVYEDKNNHKVALRYNLYKDVMEYMQGSLNMYLEPSPKISKIILGETTYVVRKFENKHQTKYGFFAVLDTGKVTLYSRKVVTFHKARKGEAPDFKDHLAGYDRESDDFYYQVDGGELREVGSIKSMIASLPERQEEMTLFAKKEKISASKEPKLIKFVQHYNSLQNGE